MEWNDTGLVLARGTFREYDVWLRVLFREHGVHTVFAFGGLHSRRRFVGCLDILNILDCHVAESRNGRYEELCEAVLVRGPQLLRTRPSRQGLAVNCLKLLDSASVPAEAAADAFRLMEESLVLLDSESGAGPLLPLFFRLKCMALLGYAPDFLQCCLCRSPIGRESFFCVEEGGVLCRTCQGQCTGRSSGAVLSLTTLQMLQAVRLSWPLQWQGLQLDGQERRKVSLCLDGMLRYHVGIAWDRGHYIRI